MEGCHVVSDGTDEMFYKCHRISLSCSRPYID